MPDAETLPCDRAIGRVVAAEVTAPISLPPFRASAMDGYALRSADTARINPRRLRVVGASSAGHPFPGEIPADACIRIFTGAAVPDGLDAVVLQEDCTREGDVVSIGVAVQPGDNIRPIGHDVLQNTPLFGPGTCIGPFEQAWLAACGVTEVRVWRRARVAIFSTGDELIEPGGAIGPGQIFDANRHALHALLGSPAIDLVDLGILPDRLADIESALATAARDYDAVVTTGGVSVGDADHVREVVDRIGQVRLWRLNLKPGKPLAYGRLGRAIFLGLPGNPVSTLVTTLLLARPALRKLCGGVPDSPLALPARLHGHIGHRPGREEYQRGKLTGAGEDPVVSVVGDQSSNRIGSFVQANCLIRIPKDAHDLTDGSRVTVLPFNALL